MAYTEQVSLTSTTDGHIMRFATGLLNASSAAIEIARSLEITLDNHQIVSLRVDLEQTKWIGSAGLNHLLHLHRKVSINGGEVTLLNVSETVAETLRLTRLERIFRIDQPHDISAPHSV